jgi:hypothetical protein
MRRTAFLFAACTAALALVATAVGAPTLGDGSLVVKNGSAPWTAKDDGTGDIPVVALKITGSVIGHVDGYGRIVIDAGSDINADAQVTGAGRPLDWKRSDTASMWTANDFTFRAVNGTFTILIYGSDVNLVAVGNGIVRLAGDPDAPRHDGKYTLNDADLNSLPNQQSPKLTNGG